jgi:hypothetical protein
MNEQQQQTANMPSASPQSSDGGASYQDSPATKLTVYSPQNRLNSSIEGPADGNKATEALTG